MATTWASATAYTVGNAVKPTTTNGFWYRCIVAGTSSGTEPGWPTTLGQTVEENTVTWECIAAGIGTDVQSLNPSGIIELFVLDATAIGGSVTRWHAGKNGLLASVVWQGNTYTAIPVEASGFEYTAQGKLPRPKIRVSNALGSISALVLAYTDLLGAKLTRKRTLVKYLDAVNFSGGVNATADPSAEFPDDVYFIDRKSMENKQVVEFELAAAFDVAGVLLPRRHIIQNVCPWVYRGSECGYTGTTYFDINDASVPSSGLDVCGKRLSSCKLRFGETAELPFGGFPASGLIR